MTGWIKINRGIANHWCSADPNFLAVWIRLLSEANFKTKKTMMNGTPVTINRGSLVFGLNAFSNKSGVSISKLRRILKLLIAESMIDRQKTNKYSIISITNYDMYQSGDKQNADKQQSDDNQTTTPKERKKDKKDNKSKYNGDFDVLWSAYGKHGSRKDALKKYEIVRRDIEQETLLKANSLYDQHLKVEDWKKKRNMTSWLNQKGWEDEYQIKKTKPSWQM